MNHHLTSLPPQEPDKTSELESPRGRHGPNGSEFRLIGVGSGPPFTTLLAGQNLSQTLDMKTWFCDPHSPWQRYLDALRHVRATKVSGQRPVFDKSYRSALQKKGYLASLYLAKVAEPLCRLFGRKHIEISDCIDRQSRERILYLIKSVNSPWRSPRSRIETPPGR